VADPIRFKCPGCGKSLTANPGQAGKRVKCPRRRCAQVIRVPLPEGSEVTKCVTSTEWYCDIRGALYGPMTAHELRRMAWQGTLAPRDRVRRGHDGEWVSAATVRGLEFPTQALPSVETAVPPEDEITDTPQPRPRVAPRAKAPCWANEHPNEGNDDERPKPRTFPWLLIGMGSGALVLFASALFLWLGARSEAARLTTQLAESGDKTPPALPGAKGPRIVTLAEPGNGIDIRSVYIDTSIPLGKPLPNPLPVSFPSGTKQLNLIIVLNRAPFGEMTAGYRISSNAGALVTRPKANEDGYSMTSMTLQSPLLALILFAEAPGESFADGPYRAVVQLNGKDCFELNWSIGGGAK
jgi:hypothetical protein